jgi:DNA polymerase-3 subunit epsilon
MHYAIVDIETTGGYANASAITEIAIIITDGVTIIEQYETLINPQQKIPYFITKLTGITDAMVASAPTFDAVAEKIFSLLNHTIFVAHNVNFDYSFVNHQLKQNDFLLTCKKLCTVRYGKKVLPGLRSYSLGNFCKAVQIPVENRHRAGGDCMATFFLLKKLLASDVHNELDKFLKNKTKDKNLPLQVEASNYTALPNGIGVYYFLDKKEKIIYVGKALNIKKRVASHFAGNKTSRQRQEFIRNIAYIKYTLVATELMSLILESTEIKKYWPKYNQAQKHFEHQFALYTYTDQKGYTRLCVEKRKKNLPPVITVKNKVDGLIQLRTITINHNLCPNKCAVEYIAKETNHLSCNGTCLHYHSVAEYNATVVHAITALQENTASFYIVEEGLQENEKSIIAVQNGNFVAMGYIPSPKKLDYKSICLDNLNLLAHNNYINALVHQYAAKHPQLLLAK